MILVVIALTVIRTKYLIGTSGVGSIDKWREFGNNSGPIQYSEHTTHNIPSFSRNWYRFAKGACKNSWKVRPTKRFRQLVTVVGMSMRGLKWSRVRTDVAIRGRNRDASLRKLSSDVPGGKDGHESRIDRLRKERVVGKQILIRFRALIWSGQ